MQRMEILAKQSLVLGDKMPWFGKDKKELPAFDFVKVPDPVYCQICGAMLTRTYLYQFDKITGNRVVKETLLDCPKESKDTETPLKHDHWGQHSYTNYWHEYRFGNSYRSPFSTSATMSISTWGTKY